ncbi:hypothetical protein DV736_g3106, partial [Chaetothyriales sp. CBS 134916]
MVFASSSPVLYPQSSSPPQPRPKKRKLFQPFVSEPTVKKTKLNADEVCPEQQEEQHKSLPSLPVDIDDIDLPPPINRPVRPASPTFPSFSRPLLRKRAGRSIPLETSSGEIVDIHVRTRTEAQAYESMIAERSKTKEGRAKRAYYGIEIHKLIDDARLQCVIDDNERQAERLKANEKPQPRPSSSSHAAAKPNAHLLWTEKYRARKFTELVGDERTHPHRKLLLLTGPPGLGKTTLAHVCARQAGYEVLEINASDDRTRDVVKGRIKDALGTETVRGIQEPGKERKMGRPVCVVVDEVDGVVTGSGGSGEGGFMKALIELVQLDQRNSAYQHVYRETEAGRKKKKGDKFRMLRPLILVCNDVYAPSLRPLRASSLTEIVHVRRPALEKVITRLKNVFELEHMPCDTDAVRQICASAWGLGSHKQGVIGGRGTGEGDIRGVLVNAEWIAHKFRASSSHAPSSDRPRLTRKWVEVHAASPTSSSSTSAKGLGRGGVREVIDRIFTDGAGLPSLSGTTLSVEDARLVAESKSTSIGISDLRKRAAIVHLREMIDQCGEHDRVMTDCFATYPLQVYQDDVRLTKPNLGYDWLHFHDSMSARVYTAQEWELLPYLSTGACGFHDLFANVDHGDRSSWVEDHWTKDGEEEGEGGSHPFAGVKADFAANEVEKVNRTMLIELQERFQAELLRMFSSINNIATELVPHVVGRMMAPDVKPVVVGGSGSTASVASVRKESEKRCVKNSVKVMHALDVRFEKVKVELEVGAGVATGHTKGGFAYRMEPPLDMLTSFYLAKGSTVTASSSTPVRYAVRQVLDQELRKEKALQAAMSRQARSTALSHKFDNDDDKENKAPTMSKAEQIKQDQQAVTGKVKRDFFGRVISNSSSQNLGSQSGSVSEGKNKNSSTANSKDTAAQVARVWVSFHEGFSNAVRKPITLKELMEGFV